MLLVIKKVRKGESPCWKFATAYLISPEPLLVRVSFFVKRSVLLPHSGKLAPPETAQDDTLRYVGRCLSPWAHQLIVGFS